jgi:hypothetical protein
MCRRRQDGCSSALVSKSCCRHYCSRLLLLLFLRKSSWAEQLTNNKRRLRDHGTEKLREEDANQPTRADSEKPNDNSGCEDKMSGPWKGLRWPHNSDRTSLALVPKSLSPLQVAARGRGQIKIEGKGRRGTEVEGSSWPPAGTEGGGRGAKSNGPRAASAEGDSRGGLSDATQRANTKTSKTARPRGR